jgi:Na+-driven multidrug efflux pump
MIMSFYFQAVGEGISSLLLASSRQIIFLAPLMYILPQYFGVNGLWLTFPVSDLLAFGVTATWTALSFKKFRIPFKMHPAPDVDEGAGKAPFITKKPATEVDLTEP